MQERRTKGKELKLKKNARRKYSKLSSQSTVFFSPFGKVSNSSHFPECASIYKKNVGANGILDGKLSAESIFSLDRLLDVGEFVFTDPKTRPCVRGYHGERFVCVVTKIDETHVTVKLLTSRCRLFIKAVSDIYTRAFISNLESRTNCW